MRSRRKLQPIDFVLVSILLHGIFSLSVVMYGMRTPPRPPETVQLDIVEAPPVVAQDADVSKAKRPEILKNQIVDQSDQALNDETPDDARFLSKHNQVVKKQTIARNRGEFQNKATKETQLGQKGSTKKPSFEDLKPSFDIAKAIEKREEHEREFQKQAEDGFLPSRQKPQKEASNQKQTGQGDRPKSAGGDASATLDYIKDLDPGLETLLSTKEFVYYSYFNRIRNRLNQYWSDKVRQKLTEMYRKGRMIASTDDKVTKCLITLDPSGRLLKVQIIGDSGVHELDEAAVEAFKAAAPFLNPPKGMIDADGTIKIRWDFILEA